MTNFSYIRRGAIGACVVVVCVLGWFTPGALAAAHKITIAPTTTTAAGNDVGANVAGLLKGYASELYGGIVAVVSLMFLVNRRYTELAVFLFAAVVVAWMVFASSDIATAAETIAKQVFG